MKRSEQLFEIQIFPRAIIIRAASMVKTFADKSLPVFLFLVQKFEHAAICIR